MKQRRSYVTPLGPVELEIEDYLCNCCGQSIGKTVVLGEGAKAVKLTGGMALMVIEMFDQQTRISRT
jgi:hypothetical protein